MRFLHVFVWSLLTHSNTYIQNTHLLKRSSPDGYFGRLLSAIVRVQPINTTVAFSTSLLNLQGEENKLEPESEGKKVVQEGKEYSMTASGARTAILSAPSDELEYPYICTTLHCMELSFWITHHVKKRPKVIIVYITIAWHKRVWWRMPQGRTT